MSGRGFFKGSALGQYPSPERGPASAQFTGPGQSGNSMTVAAASEARTGTYITLTGQIVAHQREDYYTFRDDTGTIRVEIPSERWGGRQVGPETTIRILGEVDRTFGGVRYIWVKSLDIVS